MVCLGFRGWDIADRCKQAIVVEPGYPFQRGKLDSFEGLPRRAAVDESCFVEAVDGLRQCGVVAVALAAYRRLDAGFRQALAVADRDILRPSTLW